MGHKIYILLASAFALYCNFKFFQYVFYVSKFSLQLFGKGFFRIVKTFSPEAVSTRKKKRQEAKKFVAEVKKQTEEAEIRLEHYHYRKNQFVNIKFVTEDRSRLFKGHEDIKWRHGRNSIDENTYTREASHELCYLMFLEMAVYRSKFIESGILWTNEMELFWRKICPKNYDLKAKPKKDYIKEQELKAIADFDSDRAKKYVC